jgi:hypothetical protein
MLSGITGLKCKLVKNASQRWRPLFTGAQKTANLAYDLCTIGWEKGHTPFVKVVEGQEIYNFAFHYLDHFCSTFWRFSQSNRAAWKSFAGTGALERAGRADAARRPRRGPSGPGHRGSATTWRARHSVSHHQRVPLIAAPPSRAFPLAPRAEHARAEPRRPWPPAYGVAAAPLHSATTLPCPYRGRSWLLLQGTSAYKGTRARRLRVARRLPEPPRHHGRWCRAPMSTLFPSQPHL